MVTSESSTNLWSKYDSKRYFLGGHKGSKNSWRWSKNEGSTWSSAAAALQRKFKLGKLCGFSSFPGFDPRMVVPASYSSSALQNGRYSHANTRSLWGILYPLNCFKYKILYFLKEPRNLSMQIQVLFHHMVPPHSPSCHEALPLLSSRQSCLLGGQIKTHSHSIMFRLSFQAAPFFSWSHSPIASSMLIMSL